MMETLAGLIGIFIITAIISGISGINFWGIFFMVFLITMLIGNWESIDAWIGKIEREERERVEEERKRIETEQKNKEEAARQQMLAREEAALRQRQFYAASFKNKSNMVQDNVKSIVSEQMSGKYYYKPVNESVSLQEKLWYALSEVSIPLQKLDDVFTELMSDDIFTKLVEREYFITGKITKRTE